jgi:hypothetical protein
MRRATRFLRWRLPDWHALQQPDDRHPHRRRYTRRYRRKQQLVKGVWVASGLLILTKPVVNIAIAVVLASSFLSFMLLDETP